MANKRIFYAITQVGIKADGDAGQFDEAHGVQSCGITTNYNLTQTFELGQISLYANTEDLPDVQLTMQKVLDGYPLLYHLCTQGSTTTTPTLVGRSASSFVAALAIFPDTNTHATGQPGSQVTLSGQFVNSVSYTFPVEGNATEDLTCGGNIKLWANDTRILNAGGAPVAGFTGAFTNTDAPIGVGGIVRKESIIFDTSVTSGDLNSMIADPNCTILPSEIFGISTSGVNIKDSDGNYPAHIQNISVSVDLNRQALNELGHLKPYTRYANFPVEVTTEVSVISVSGDMVSANEQGILSTGTGCGSFRGNLRNGTIRIATCEGTRIYCGLKNKLRSVNYTGGDTGGGNVETTYSFSNFNDLTVIHSGDPHASGGTWWTNRSSYLIN